MSQGSPGLVMRVKHYLNLTNGLEALATLPAGEPWAFLRLQSTTLEKRDWSGLFLGLDADLLMHLSLGTCCIVHDRGTARPLSKTVYYGLPLVEYVLNRRWHDLDPGRVLLVGPHGGPGPDAWQEFSGIYEGLMDGRDDKGAARRRIDYFGRYKQGHAVKLSGASEATDHDGDRAYYRDLAARLPG
jgi:hypothetical protein